MDTISHSITDLTIFVDLHFLRLQVDYALTAFIRDNGVDLNQISRDSDNVPIVNRFRLLHWRRPWGCLWCGDCLLRSEVLSK